MAQDAGVKKQELIDYIENTLDDEQQIFLNETDDDVNSHAVGARQLTIAYSDRSAAEPQRHHSHYIVTKPCIEYNWEKQFYHGHLIAFHMSKKYFAYCLQTHHSGKVRVTKIKEDDETERRCLLKEFETQLVDIDFAHTSDAIYIACMEQNGWCTVFNIVDDAEMKYSILVKVRIDAEQPLFGSCRAMWCIHVPEPGRKPLFSDENNPGNRLILTTNGKVIVVSVPIIAANSDNEKKITISGSRSNGVALTVPGSKVWDVKMSPDGVVLCAARDDGNVHFYQCVLEKGNGLVENANLVYTWTPHDGRPVHTIHFFDDFSINTKQDQFWMFALSGCEFGRQFRIWNCQHWYCIQTINVEPSPSRPKELPMLHVTVDPQGNYLILGDSERGLLMYLRVDKDIVKRAAWVTSVNEFVAGAPILNVVAAYVDIVRPPGAEENGFESRLLTLHSRLLQHMDIAFVGEMLPEQIPQTAKEPIYSDPAVTHVKKLSERNSPTDLNGEPKLKNRKKPKKGKEDFATLDDVPTPTLPEADLSFNGHPAFYTESDILDAAGCISPPFVLQPPSVFDNEGPLNTESDSSLMGTKSELNIEENGRSSATNSDLRFQRENSGGNLLNTFGVPPVEETREDTSEASTQSFVRDGGTRGPMDYGGSTSSALPGSKRTSVSKATIVCFACNQPGHHWRNCPEKEEENLPSVTELRSLANYSHHKAPTATSTAREQVLRDSAGVRIGRPDDMSDAAGAERWDKMEAMVTSMFGMIQQQSDMIAKQNAVLDRVTASMDVLKTLDPSGWGSSGSGDRDDVIKRGFDAVIQSIRPLHDLGGMEIRLNAAVEGLGKSLEATLSKEMKSQLGQNTEKALKPLGEKIKSDVASKLSGLDMTLRQKFDEAVKNPQFFGTMAQTVAPQFNDIARQAAHEALGQLVRSNQEMMGSSMATLNQSFANGTKEYLAQVNHSLESHFARVDAAFDDRVRHIEQATERTVVAAVQAASAQTIREMQQLIDQKMDNFSDRILQSLSTQISQNVNNIVRTEMREGQNLMHESVMQALRSGVATPAPRGVDQDTTRTQLAMQEVDSALKNLDYNGAFRAALSANSLRLVVYACEKCNVKDVFGNAKNLQPSVLLSLIQQLTADLSTKTDLKIQYLEEAMLAVRCEDLSSSSYKFLRTVLTDAVKGFAKFLQTNPDHPLKSIVRFMANQADMQLNQLNAQTGHRTSE